MIGNKVEVHIEYEAIRVTWDCPHCGNNNEFEMSNFSGEDTNVCLECGLTIDDVSGATDEFIEYNVTEEGRSEDDEESEED